MTGENPTSDPSSMEAQLKGMHEQFVDSLAARMVGLRSAWRRIVEESDEGAIQDMYQSVHRLTGSGGTFGCPKITATARPLEELLEGLLPDPTPVLQEEGDRLLTELEHAVVAAIATLKTSRLP